MFFKMLRRMITGEVLHVSEVPISNGNVTLRLKLKRERGTGDLYVALSMTSLGSDSFQYLGPVEFSEFALAVQQTQSAMETEQGQSFESP